MFVFICLKKLLFVSVLVLVTRADDGHHGHKQDVCESLLNYKIRNEIASYQSIVNLILNKTINGNFRGKTFEKLSTFVEEFGARPLGSQNLEDAITSMFNSSVKCKMCLCTEKLPVVNWTRGSESLNLIEPVEKNLTVFGLGLSVATPPKGITAEILVVESFQDLQQKSLLAKNKIVVFNNKFASYDESSKYRKLGANAASKFGALAVLIRPITESSFKIPHVGLVEYGNTARKIPAACISVHDAEMLQHLAESEEPVRVTLKMASNTSYNATSRNTVIKINGSDNPEKSVIISGHIDSLDVGQGAVDDGVGVLLSWMSVLLLKELRLRPKRTISAIFWTGEEFDRVGAKKYVKRHFHELKDIMIALETDDGGFSPVGLRHKVSKTGACVLEEIMKLFSGINATHSTKFTKDYSTDLDVLSENGVPTAMLHTNDRNYLSHHQSDEDSIEAVRSEDLDTNLGLWASLAFILANLSIDFPRDDTRISIFGNFSRPHYYNYQEPSNSTVFDEDDNNSTISNTPNPSTDPITEEITTTKRSERLVEDNGSKGWRNSISSWLIIHVLGMYLLFVVIY